MRPVRPVYYSLRAKSAVLRQCLATKSIFKHFIERAGKNYFYCLMIYQSIYVYCTFLRNIYSFSTVFCTNTDSVLRFRRKCCMKVLILRRDCSFAISTVPSEFCICQELECSTVYLYLFVTQFPTVSIIAMNDARKCLLTRVSVQKLLVFILHLVHLPSITKRIAATLLNSQSCAFITTTLTG